MKQTFTFYNDPGHGWLKVPLELLTELEITDKITEYSYMSLNSAYLEEDLDAATFDKAMKAKGKEYTTKNKHTNKASTIRAYARYSPKYALKQIKNGSEVKLVNGMLATVNFIKGSRTVYLKHVEGAYLVSKQNLIEYISEVL